MAEGSKFEVQALDDGLGYRVLGEGAVKLRVWDIVATNYE